jgi:hypothetical protein
MFLLSDCNEGDLEYLTVRPGATGWKLRVRSPRRGGKQMVRISVEVSSGAARFRVMVQAESIERALEIAKRHNPGKECRVAFPLDPEAFFARDPVTKAGVVEAA